MDPEALSLTKAAPLCRGQFAKARRQVLAQDARGYVVAPAVYGATTPAEDTLKATTC